MAVNNAPFVVFNGGEIGPETLCRVTLENYAATAEVMENVWLETNGPMGLRPGLGYQTTLGSGRVRLQKFIRSPSERFLLCLSDGELRIADPSGATAEILARPAVTAALTNGDFEADGSEFMVSGINLTASSTASGTALANLLDNDSSTVWMSASGETTSWVKIDLLIARQITRFWLTAADTYGHYAPTAWILTGSDTGAFAGEQVTLYTRTASAPYANGETRVFEVNAAAAYRYYRLLITANGNDGLIDGEYTIDGDGNTVWTPGPTSGYRRLAKISMTDLPGWTDISDSGTSAAIADGRLLLNADGTHVAGVRQEVTVNEADTLHALEITIHHGPVRLRVGSTAGGTDLIGERELRTGFHSLAFVPSGGSFWIDLVSSVYRQVEVESVAVAATGDLVLATPWAEADLQSLRFEQTLNVVYVFRGADTRHMRIERWDNNSWALTETDEANGPWLDQNSDKSVTITPSVRVGNGTLTSSKALFAAGHVGSLWKLIQGGQFQTRVVDGADQWSEPVLVQGVSGARAVSASVSGGLTGRVRLQMSVGNTTSWADAASKSGSTSGNPYADVTGSAVTFAFNDGLDNNKVYYRVGVKSGEYTSGSATVTISFSASSTEGVVRVTNINSDQSASMEVLTTLASSSPTELWAEGAWSDYRGWPRAGTVFDGRLWTLRDDKFWGSYSDSFESHLNDDGKSSAIARGIGFGSSNTGQWMIGLSRLIIGADGAEDVVRSSAFDEPLSTTNMTVREMSTYGAGDVQPIKIDTRALYLDASGFHLMEMAYNVQVQDYVARPLSQLHRDIGRPGITQVDAMRRPDTRALAVRADGQLLTKLFDPGENVMGWARWTSPGASGVIESVCVLPHAGQNQDELYVSVARTVNGATKRYLEKLGPLYAAAKTDTRCLDSYVTYAGAATRTLPVVHLKGATVRVWADGAYLGEHVVDATTGNVVLPSTEATVTSAVIGLAYKGRYKGPMLAFGARMGTAIAQQGAPNKISFKVRKTVLGGLSYGRDYDEPSLMDTCEDRTQDDDLDSGPAWFTGWVTLLDMPGDIGVDPRVCLEMEAPMPVTIDGFVIGELMNERGT